ncbi:MAG: Gfo/Idh/MocA family protein [Halolamina sp.]
MYNAAIVGCGVIGDRLAESFTEHDETTVWGACDLIEERAESFAVEYDCEAYTDYEAMVAEDAVDIVYVGVPPVVHREVVAAAVEAGAAVICEKPMAQSTAVAEELVELEELADGPTAVNLPFRYTPGFVEMRERIADGDIGDPQRIELTFRFPQWPREWQDVEWLTSREQGGPLREVGTHYLFGVQEAFSPIDWVNAEVAYTGPESYEHSITGYFGVDGVGGTLDLLTDCGADEQNSMTVVGTEGSLSLLDWYRLAESAEGEPQQTVNDTRGETTVRLIDEFVTAMDGGDGDLVSFAEATQVQRVVDALFDSEGKPVAIPDEL